MGIFYCSKDMSLVADLTARYGADQVILQKDSLLSETSLLPSYEVAIVDLKHYSLPATNPFSVPIIALTVVPSFKEAVLLIQKQVRGYGNRRMRLENLFQAIESVKAGQIWLPPTIISQLIGTIGSSNIPQPDADILAVLSKRELEVADHVARGMSNQEIADTICVSLRTVKAHLSSIYDKTGFRNRLELGLFRKNARSVSL